jgi:hypothetical protein
MAFVGAALGHLWFGWWGVAIALVSGLWFGSGPCVCEDCIVTMAESCGHEVKR